MNIKIKFEPKDIWVGLYWNKEYLVTCVCNLPKDEGKVQQGKVEEILKLYICLIPLFPIIVEFSPKPAIKNGTPMTGSKVTFLTD